MTTSSDVLTPGLRIELDDLRRNSVRRLITEHLQEMAATSPPESMHALDLDALRSPGADVLDGMGR